MWCPNPPVPWCWCELWCPPCEDRSDKPLSGPRTGDVEGVVKSIPPYVVEVAEGGGLLFASLEASKEDGKIEEENLASLPAAALPLVPNPNPRAPTFPAVTAFNAVW